MRLVAHGTGFVSTGTVPNLFVPNETSSRTGLRLRKAGKVVGAVAAVNRKDHRQGIEQGLLESIREVLELRFGAGAAEPLGTHLEAIGGDVQRLKQLHRGAIQAPGLEAFRRLLGAAD